MQIETTQLRDIHYLASLSSINIRTHTSTATSRAVATSTARAHVLLFVAAVPQTHHPKPKSKQRFAQAFMVSMEEQLTEALERVKLLEQEGDAFNTLAKEEEVARIAAVSLPKRKDDISYDDNFSLPKKRPRLSL
ncbi:hypothetical protein K4K53_006046 [Colletotrichum sp. SAR 10_77]|nr:hypothetical protein K4K51_006782 [Colletotrichum sp. SAR 10_75]KAI8226732.1 hypothetical protein K4K53_006046 [Colletotrichum sp. SAR 10_77]